MQYNLSQQTGQGPVEWTSDTPDRQASNVRLWAASSETIVPDIYNAFSDPQIRNTFFDDLRNYINSL